MHIKYQFLTGEMVDIEVPDHIGEVSIAIERDMLNSNRRETRRHNSISRMEDAGSQFADEKIDVAELLLKNEDNRRLYDALQHLLPQQQDLIWQVFYEEKSLASIAREFGVTEGAMRHRLSKIYKRLQSFLA